MEKLRSKERRHFEYDVTKPGTMISFFSSIILRFGLTISLVYATVESSRYESVEDIIADKTPESIRPVNLAGKILTLITGIAYSAVP